MDQTDFTDKSAIKYQISQFQDDARFQDPAWMLEKWTSRFIASKRSIDIFGGILLLVVLVVTFPPIVIAIILDSRGSVFYTQERVGKNGEVFNVLKYRSMKPDAEVNGAQFATMGDPRITRVGNFLRKSRLDELPQAINVLRGEMSIVGPRPERPHVIEEVSERFPAFRMRTLVQPGLTGWAQVKGAYAADFAQLAEKLEFDLYYIRNASIEKDIAVMLETFRVVLHRKGQ